MNAVMNALPFAGPVIGILALAATTLYNLRPATRERRVKHSKEEFVHQREEMRGDRQKLATLAADFHLRANKELARVAGTDLLGVKSLVLDSPIKLQDIECQWVAGNQGQDQRITKAASAILPLRAPGKRFDTYSSAMSELCRPGIFRNDPSYRLLRIDLEGASPRADFGECRYFDMIDVAEALAHELSGERRRLAAGKSRHRLRLRRKFVDDVLALDRRAVLPSIATLTLVRGGSRGGHRLYLHDRAESAVAISTDLFQVIPAGVFQPASRMPQGYLDEDLNLWRNVMREYAEEMLGEEEHSGEHSGRRINYGEGIFRTLEEGVSNGELTVHCFGLGIDPLTLTAEFLTVATFDDGLFFRAFPSVVEANLEGTVIKNVPFDKRTVDGLLAGSLAPSGAACVALAWMHRRELLRC